MSATANISHNIFLADDDEDDRILFLQALQDLEKNAGFAFATNGVDLMKHLHNDLCAPQILFLDWNMPLKNGMECLDEIRRETGALQQLPIIIFSTSSNPASVDEAFRGGASRYVVKPSDFAALKDVIRKVLGINWNQLPVERREFLVQA